MSSIEVKSISIPVLLSNLHSGEWLTPEFQRDFVWTTAQVISLVNSLLDAKPIGMATIWQQEEKSDLPLEHISINDWDAKLSKSAPRFFGNNDERPGRYFAVLDGKQRATAIAMVFGGLRAQNGTYKNSGAYFLNADFDDLQDRVQYLSKKDIESRALNTMSAYVQNALFPLELPGDFEKLSQHFFKMISSIEVADNYPGGTPPDKETIQKRQDALQNAHDGINQSRLAVYIVPKKETLGDICDIFEVLNTTGTKVTTVDLIHASIYAETAETKHPILLREEIDLLSELDGLQEWSTSSYRPELVAQNVAAIQIALDRKHDPRPVTGRNSSKITSIKSSDLLAISSASWRDYFDNREFVAQCFLDFQLAVAGGRFGIKQCPYPAIFNVYNALRWYLKFDAGDGVSWTKEKLDRIFRAFFWRNTFSRRYDQGFLTRVSVDIAEFKDFLNASDPTETDQLWAAKADKFLTNLTQMNSQAAMQEQVREAVTDGNLRGALRLGGLLLLHTRAKNDLVDINQDISHITGAHELHHILPKSWCKDNVTEKNRKYLKSTKEQTNWVESPANLIPMAPKSNKAWNTMSPKTAIETLNLRSPIHLDLFDRYFVDTKCLEHLLAGAEEVGQFLEARAQLIQKEIIRLMQV